MTTLGENIKDLRKQRGMTQRELAEAMGFSDHTPVSKVEKGNANWTAAQIQMAAKVLGTSVTRLVGRDEDLPEDAQQLIEGFLALDAPDKDMIRELISRLAREARREGR